MHAFHDSFFTSDLTQLLLSFLQVKIDHEVSENAVSHDLPPSLEGSSHHSSLVAMEEPLVKPVHHPKSSSKPKSGTKEKDKKLLEKKGEEIVKKKKKVKKEKVQHKEGNESQANGSDPAVKVAKVTDKKTDKKKSVEKDKKVEKKETLKDRLFRSLKTLKKKSSKVVKKNGKNPLSIRNDSSGSNSAIGSPMHTKMGDKDELGSFMHEDSETDNETIEEVDEVETEVTPAVAAPDSNNFMSMYPNGIGLHGRPIVLPRFVVRPAPLKEDCSEDEMDKEDDDTEEEDEDDSSDEEAEAKRERRRTIRKHLRKLRRPRMPNLALQRDVIFPVLKYLNRKDILSCSAVCKPWNAWTTDPSFWDTLSACGKKVTPDVLISIVKRQPKHLDLSWTRVSFPQMEWLLPRIPQLQTLNMAGCSASTISALCSSNCPLLKSLDISWVDAFDDDLFRDLLSSPPDQRPGLYENKTRLRNLQELKISGSEVTDAAIRVICSSLPQMTKLHLSNCSRITDMGIAILSACSFADKLTELMLYSCERLTDHTLDSLANCPKISNLDLRNCPSVTCGAFTRFYQMQRRRNNFAIIQTHNKCIKYVSVQRHPLMLTC